MALEAALRVLMARAADPTVAGVWLDWIDPRREPIWLPTAAGAAKEAEAALELKTSPLFLKVSNCLPSLNSPCPNQPEGHSLPPHCE